MSFLKWFYPGMGVKRWIALTMLGTFLLVIGFGVMLNSELLGYLEKGIIYEVYHLFPGRFTLALLMIVFFVLGLLFIGVGLKNTVQSIISVFVPESDNKLVEIIFQKRFLERGPRIVVLGGGTGLSVLLRGLKQFTTNLTAIVTVADDGGSSGRLREELGILPPGDIRNCLLALADTEPLMARLFAYRFDQGTGPLSGHSFGNLFLAAMTAITGDFEEAIRASSKVLAVKGQVLPSTMTDVVLHAEMADGQVISGESEIPKARGRIRRVFLKPENPQAQAEALQAIREADAIILGPGSLYTSVIPNLLVKDMAEAIGKSPAPVFYICNVMTQPGETDGYTAADHLQAIIDHGREGLVDYCIVNSEPVREELRKRYAAEGAEPVALDREKLRGLCSHIHVEPLLAKEDAARHDPEKLARAVMKLVVNHKVLGKAQGTQTKAATKF